MKISRSIIPPVWELMKIKEIVAETLASEETWNRALDDLYETLDELQSLKQEREAKWDTVVSIAYTIG